ncbi:MAG: CDP-glycerol glycerophosphotransferase family protein, partial [Campylobacter sp.]|nr:CDP-glycerol glycerophosphotransferase family protein [Campylobacter sp.]
MATNQNKHNKLRFLNILLGIPAVLLSFFLPSKKGRIIINSHFNTKFDYNSKYLFLYMLKQSYDVWFVINDDEFRAELIKIYGNHFIETNSFKGKIFALRSKIWFVSAFEMPVGGAFFKYFRKVIHLTHGSLLKNVGLLEKDISFVKKIYYKFF